ncbi:MAG: TetR/AcrR family transcriptional regulator [Phycisphaeraceae bacterium]
MSDSSHKPSTSSPAQGCAAEAWTQADHAARRAMIVDTALALLHEDDLKAVTMRRVAERLGVGAMTLYTYIDGQHELYREMVRRGFEMLHENCVASSTLGTPEGWRGGARAYIQFALTHPNLYKLMFDTPDAEGEGEVDLLRGGFEPLLEKVREHLAAEGLSGETLNRRARAAAGRYWIALHGLATLAIAGRLVVLEGDVDQILDDMLPRIAPTA